MRCLLAILSPEELARVRRMAARQDEDVRTYVHMWIMSGVESDEDDARVERQREKADM